MKKAFLFLGSVFMVLQMQAQVKITAEELDKAKDQTENQILDVRTEKEFQEGHVKNAKNINWNDKALFESAITKLDKNKPVYVYCLGGGRSKQAAALLTEKGFQVFDYSGGMMDWRNSDRPVVKEVKANSSDNEKTSGLSMDQFNKLVNSADVVLVNYSAVWCGPCQTLKPTILKIQKEQAKKVKVVRLDADANPELMKALKITGIPRIGLFKNGKEVWKHTGVISEEKIMAQVNKVAK